MNFIRSFQLINEKYFRNTGSKKILEINSGHPIMKELLERVKETPDTETEELVRTLTETALINSGIDFILFSE